MVNFYWRCVRFRYKHIEYWEVAGRITDRISSLSDIQTIYLLIYLISSKSGSQSFVTRKTQVTKKLTIC